MAPSHLPLSKLLSLGIFALLFIACAPGAAPPDEAASIDQLFSDYLARENIPGVALVALRGDEIAERRGFGAASNAGDRPIRPDSLQPIYSVSKQFTAVLILRLVDDGLIDLDAPVGRYLPQFEDETTLTISTLLRHTSGVADFIMLPEILAIDNAPRGTGSLAQTVDIIDAQPRRFAPDARYSYSNSNYTILARVAEVVTGEAFDDALQARVLGPAGIAGVIACERVDGAALTPGHDSDGASRMLPPNLTPNYAGNGGLCASADGLAQWTRALGAGRVLRSDQMTLLLGAQPVSSGYTPPYGFGVSTILLAGRPAISHSGGGEGWGAWAAYLPEEEITIVLLANRGWFWPTDLGLPMVRNLAGISAPAPLQRLRLSAAERAAMSGRFEDGLFDVELTAEDDRLVLDNPAFGEPLEFWKQPDGRYVSSLRPDSFSLRNSDGRIEMDWMETRSYFERVAG